jgi:hypothetical protein
MPHSLLFVLTVLAPFGPVAVTAQQAATGFPSLVLEIPVDSLRDVAVAVYSPNRGIIYYNPTLMAALGPDLAAFFRQHELGHLYFHHVRGNALLAGESVADSVMQAGELQADCYAARTLSPTNTAAARSAALLFSRLGGSHTPDHPAGAERAAMILSCIRRE